MRKFTERRNASAREKLCNTIRDELWAVWHRSGPSEEGLDFICETDVERIWTEPRVKSLSKGLTWDTPELHEKSRTRFRRILSILVWIHWERWVEFKMIFLDHGLRSDSNLPLPDDQVPDHYEMRLKFLRGQYIFCPVTLVKDRRHERAVQLGYDKQVRLPFVKSIKIGEGATSIVTKELIAANHFRYSPGSFNSEPIWVARKRFRQGDVSSKNFVAEQEALTSFKQCLKSNSNILLSLTTYTHDSYFNIISPLADLDLHLYLHGEYWDFEERKQDFSPLNLLQELACLASALHFLHFELQLQDKTIACAHLDFKPENILVKWYPELPVGRWLLTDFGTARIKESSEATDTLAPGDFLTQFSFTKARRRPGPFQAPEVQLVEDRVVGRESDLWSLGCLHASILAFAIGGKEHVSGLANSRYHDGQLTGTRTDYFYEHINKRAILKPTLTAWLNGLKTDKQEDRWINRGLELTFKLLVEEPRKRLSASDTKTELDVICRKEREFLKRKCNWSQPETPMIFDAPEVVGVQPYHHPSMPDIKMPMDQAQHPHQSRYAQQAYPLQLRHSNFTESTQPVVNGGLYQQPQPQNIQYHSGQQAQYSHPGHGVPYDQSSQQGQNMDSGHRMQQDLAPGEYIYTDKGLQYDQDIPHEGSLASECDSPKQSIESQIKPEAPFSDSGFASMPSSAARSTGDRPAQVSVHDNSTHEQLCNQTSEIEHVPEDVALGPADEDLQSVVSDTDEIYSQIPTQKTQQQMIAERHLTVLLAQHEDLKPLYEIALNQMEKERFVNNFRRILKRYHLDLVESANTNLERATVHLLRNRWTRVRIAQDIANRVRPESDELHARLLADMRDIEEKIPGLESWIAGNPGLAPPMEPQEPHDDDGDDANANLNDTASDSDDSASEGDQEEEDLLPNLAQMKSFLLQSISFRSLVTNTSLFLLSPALNSLSRVLMTIPYDRIHFSSEDNISVLNRAKGFAEDLTEESWNWWPMQPRMRPLAKDQTRVYWKCHCGSTQWAEISLSQAKSYQMILQQNRSALQNNHLCRTRRTTSWRTALEGIIAAAGSVITGTQPFMTRQNTQSLGQQNIPLKSNVGRGLPATNISRIPAGPATSNQHGVQINIGGQSTADLYILFGVEGARRTLELEQIRVKEHSEDDLFFKNLRHAYKRNRGFWRYWFSIWQLAHCDFVKFIKLRANRIIYHSKSLPEDITYEYQPRPPTAENPPILPHEFELAFSTCSSKCLFSAFHDCVEPPTGTFAVERIPKRTSMIEISSNSQEFAWGIQAQHAISFLRMLFYHLLIFAGTFGFWAWWLVKHPNDLQNAAVPLTTAGVLLSLFWGSAGILKFKGED